MGWKLLVCAVAYLALAVGGTASAEEFLDEPAPGGPKESAVCDSCGECGAAAKQTSAATACDCQRLLGMLPSDHCFDRFHQPAVESVLLRRSALADRSAGHLHRQ